MAERPELPDDSGETLRDWEIIQSDTDSTTARLKIVGGWLYRTATADGVAMVFVPGRLTE